MSPVDPNPKAVQQLARIGRLTWSVLLGAGAVVEVAGILHPGKEDTLSEHTVWLWRLHGRRGRAVFVVAWTGFAVWFPPHLIKIARQRSAS